MHPTRVLLFGDQTVDKLGTIRELTHFSKSSPTLRRFLRESADVVQIEAAKLGPIERNAFSGFDDLLTMAEANAKQAFPDELVATPLMCIARLGVLLLYAEKEPGVLNPVDTKMHMIGFCTGLVPAAAALVATDVAGLLKYGLEMVAVSVRLGYAISARSKRVEENPGCWAYSIVGATATSSQAFLDTFHESNRIPPYRQAYVAVISRTWTTIFGPPSTLTKLWEECPELGLAPKLKLAAAGAVHASQLPPLDPAKIIGDSKLLDIAIQPDFSIVSSSTGEHYSASDLRGLLHQMLGDIGENTLHLTETVQKSVSDLPNHEKVELYVVGPTAHTTLVQDAMQKVGKIVEVFRQPDPPTLVRSTRGGSDLIAIVGMSGRFPGGGESLRLFWEMLLQGQETHEKVPESRFNIATHFDKDGSVRNTTSVPYGCFIQRPGLFDSRMFNVSPREAKHMDPIQRLLLLTTYEALEMSGYNLNGSQSTETNRISTYIGQCTDDWCDNNESQGVDVYHIPGVARAFHPGRINHHFKWEGGAYSLDCACASSSTAVASACAALLSRECDTAIAGGGNLLSAPLWFSGLSRGGFLSKTGGCKTFRDDADGYCRGEGVGVVVLKRLEDALAENDNVLAVINGFARTHSGDAASITQPTAESQRKIYQKVFQRSGVDPQDIGYVEMHGTGTQAGDPIEVQSVGDIFCAGRKKDNPLYVGAVKANMGHGEAAAGITSLIKSVLMLRERRIPPQPGMPFKVNHKFPPLEKMHMRIPGESRPFDARSKDGKRRIFLNNFDAAGGNTALIIEEFVHQRQRKHDPRSWHIVTCSGHTSYSLHENKQKLLQFVKSNPGVKIPDLAYTTTARKMHHAFRASFSVRTTEEFANNLSADIAKAQSGKASGFESYSSIVWAFTGQGSFYRGMGKQLFETCARFRESILSYQRICDLQGLPYIVDLISNPGGKQAKDETMVQTQLAIIFLELALADLWKSWGLKPDLLIGHSLGEYSALCVSGVVSVTDTLYLVGKRSSILQDRCTPGTHAMLAVDWSSENLGRFIETERLSSCKISCRNAPNQTVASGTIEDLKQLDSRLKGQGAKTKMLRVPYGFHSSQVEPILDEFEACAQGVHFAQPTIPVVSTMTKVVVSNTGHFSPHYLARQAREPVDFLGALQACKTNRLVGDQTIWVDLGPDPMCLGMIRSSLGVSSNNLLATIKSTEDNWKTASTSLSSAYLAKVPIDWKAYHQEYVDSLTFLELPAYAFDLKEYWSPYNQDMIGTGTGKATTEKSNPLPVSATPLTTCLQYLVHESFTAEAVSATFMSYTSEPSLYELISGHIVNGVALCPASVFCDMAYTAAGYLFAKANPNKAALTDMSLHGLNITHPVVIDSPDQPKKIEVTATKLDGDWSVGITYRSGDSSQNQNGSCQVRLGAKDSWKREVARSLHLVKKRTETVVKSSTCGDGHRLLKPIVYKLFSDLVSYGEGYQGLNEVFLDKDGREAVGRVKLGHHLEGGRFTQNPYWLDSIVHLAGFILNGDVTKAVDIAFIATGFEALYAVEELSEDHQYTSYVCMQEGEKKDELLGDIYVFRGEVLVALCAGLCFHKMLKRTLSAIMGKTAGVQQVSASLGSTAQLSQKTISKALPISTSGTSTSSATLTNGHTPHDISSAMGPAKEKRQDTASLLLGIIASESGVDINDLQPATTFSDLGVDSLMSITILSAAKSQLDMDMPASFFIDHPTVKDLQEEFSASTDADDAPDTTDNPELGQITEESSTDTPTLTPVDTAPEDITTEVDGGHNLTNGDTTIDKHNLTNGDTTIDNLPTRERKSSVDASQPRGKVILLQGRASSKETPVYLLTDGAGSATAYIYLPPLPGGRRLYTIESPYLPNPTEWRCSIEEYCSYYVATLQESQPHGPYIIGGWSAGSVFAFETCRQLTHEKGEQIKCLFMIDMRVPRPMPDALEPTHELIEQAGLVTGIKRSGQAMNEISMKVKEHLVSTVKALTRFQPQPMDPAHRPGRSFMVWARQGLGQEKMSRFKADLQKEVDAIEGNVMEDPNTGLKGWFFAKRTAFGPNGWDELVGDVECHVMEADHFSMVTPPEVKELGRLLRMAVEKSEAAWSEAHPS